MLSRPNGVIEPWARRHLLTARVGGQSSNPAHLLPSLSPELHSLVQEATTDEKLLGLLNGPLAAIRAQKGRFNPYEFGFYFQGAYWSSKQDLQTGRVVNLWREETESEKIV